jgi:hypothetical protein
VPFQGEHRGSAIHTGRCPVLMPEGFQPLCRYMLFVSYCLGAKAPNKSPATLLNSSRNPSSPILLSDIGYICMKKGNFFGQNL